MHGMGVAEAAEVLGVAEGTIKSRCARGRAALAELLGIVPSGRTVTRPASGVEEPEGNRSSPPDV
jgi:RNA polymerase sigma-70 factor, ECF subfamily